MMVTRTHVDERLMDLGTQIMAAFDDYHNAVMDQLKAGGDLRAAEVDLEATQDAILLDPEFSLVAKNETTRAAHLRAQTETQYLAHRAAESQYTRARLIATDRLELLHTLRALSTMFGGVPHV